jgi:small subunit ribosomal protein S1
MVLDIDKEKRQLRLSIKQLIPTSLDEFVVEHKTGDSVTGRVVSVENGVAQIELGEGIFCSCKLPTEPAPIQESAAPESTPAKVDLSAFSSMLKTKWKTGSAAGSSPNAKLGSSGSNHPEPAKPGQVRNFRIAELDATAKKIILELIS